MLVLSRQTFLFSWKISIWRTFHLEKCYFLCWSNFMLSNCFKWIKSVWNGYDTTPLPSLFILFEMHQFYMVGCINLVWLSVRFLIVQIVIVEMENDHLTKIHLIEIVIFQLIESFNNESFKFYHLTEFFETFQLIKILK